MATKCSRVKAALLAQGSVACQATANQSPDGVPDQGWSVAHRLVIKLPEGTTGIGVPLAKRKAARIGARGFHRLNCLHEPGDTKSRWRQRHCFGRTGDKVIASMSARRLKRSANLPPAAAANFDQTNWEETRVPSAPLA